MSGARRNQFNFMACLIVLCGFAAYLQVKQSHGSLRLIKAALPIRKPLADFDRSKLAPLDVINSMKLPPETVEELGTREYINWTLAAPKDGGGGARGCTMSVTYYTGVVDQVPHVPEECFFQGAFTQASDQTMNMNLPLLGETIEIRRLSFYPPRDLSIRTFVYYTICVNGEFYGHRDRVRFRMANPLDTHLYYSKVEVAIKQRRNDEDDNGDVSELDEAAREVLDKVITELVRSHWPLRGWERGGPPSDARLKTNSQAQTAAKGV